MLTGGIDIAKYNDYPGDGERYDIRVKAKEGEFQQQVDLSKIYLRNRQGELVRLDSVARFREALGPAVIARFDLQYSATFYATTVPLGAAIEKVRAAAQNLPIGYRVVFVGEAEQLEKTAVADAVRSSSRSRCSSWCSQASSTASCSRSTSCWRYRSASSAASPRSGFPVAR